MMINGVERIRITFINQLKNFKENSLYFFFKINAYDIVRHIYLYVFGFSFIDYLFNWTFIY